MELINYETIFILTPVLSEQHIKEAIDKYRNYLVERKAVIIAEEAIGLKKLAYPIAHKKTGIYHVIEFQGAPHLIKDLEVTYKRDEKVLRFLTFSLDKHGVMHNKKRREGPLSQEIIAHKQKLSV